MFFRINRLAMPCEFRRNILAKNSVLKTVMSSFDLAEGRKIAGKYEVLSLLGAGWEEQNGIHKFPAR